jgi:hypothetical protein
VLPGISPGGVEGGEFGFAAEEFGGVGGQATRMDVGIGIFGREKVVQVGEDEAAEALLVEKDIAVAPEFADAVVVGGLQQLLVGIGLEIGLAWSFFVRFVDVEADLVKGSEVGLPLRVGEFREAFAGRASCLGEHLEQVRMLIEERVDRGRRRDVADGIADEVDHGVAALEEAVEFLQCRAAERSPLFLSFDTDARALDVASEELAVGAELGFGSVELRFRMRSVVIRIHAVGNDTREPGLWRKSLPCFQCVYVDRHVRVKLSGRVRRRPAAGFVDGGEVENVADLASGEF